jgi:multiple sugar transport system permease protein
MKQDNKRKAVRKPGNRPAARIALYLFVILMCAVILYPYFVMFTYGARNTADIMSGNVFPEKWFWANYAYVLFSDRSVVRYLLNSVFISFGATAIAIVCGIPAAYALARMRFRGRKVFMAIVILSQMFSPVVLLVGIQRVLLTFGLNNSDLGLILIDAAFNQAFAIWLLQGTFRSISPEMEQAATIDGCSTIQSVTRVLLPMAAPGIVTTLIFVFINAWNEYTIAFVMISDDRLKPITVGINLFNGYNMIEWNYLFAASVFATVPVVILFICIEKNLVSGLTSGGVKS